MFLFYLIISVLLFCFPTERVQRQVNHRKPKIRQNGAGMCIIEFPSFFVVFCIFWLSIVFFWSDLVPHKMHSHLQCLTYFLSFSLLPYSSCPYTVSGEHEPNVILKDNDIKYKIRLPRSTTESLIAQIRSDVDFLFSIGVMDYSLLGGCC